jgi:hypothetical protein
MSEEPANRVLEFLRTIRGDIAEMRQTLRIARIEARLDLQSV